MQSGALGYWRAAGKLDNTNVAVDQFCALAAIAIAGGDPRTQSSTESLAQETDSSLMWDYRGHASLDVEGKAFRPAIRPTLL